MRGAGERFAGADLSRKREEKDRQRIGNFTTWDFTRIPSAMSALGIIARPDSWRFVHPTDNNKGGTAVTRMRELFIASVTTSGRATAGRGCDPRRPIPPRVLIALFISCLGDCERVARLAKPRKNDARTDRNGTANGSRKFIEFPRTRPRRAECSLAKSTAMLQPRA